MNCRSSYSIFSFYIYARFFFVTIKNSSFLIIFLRSLFNFFFFFFCLLEKDINFICLKMSDLIIFLNEAFEMKMNTMIEKLKNCFSEEKYRMQTIILNRIIQTSVILDEKTETFWQYVWNDSDSWRLHHSTVLNFVTIYFVISEIVNAIKKERSVYQKTIHIMKRFWEKKKYDYAID